MRYSRLGNSGLVISKLAFGAMTLGDRWAGPLAGLTGGEGDRLVGEALDNGINFFDTADVYHKGESEILLGKALGSRRGDAVIATKAGMRSEEHTSELQSLMRISYAVFCLKKKKCTHQPRTNTH